MIVKKLKRAARAKQRLLKSIALFMVGNLAFELAFPTCAYALNGGPSQPEVQSF